MAQLIASIRTTQHEIYKIIAALLSVYLLWGSTYLAVNIALESFPPFTLVSIRFFLAGFLLLILAFSRGEKLPNLRLIANAALIGCLTMGAGTVSIAIAVQWVSTGLTSLAIAAVPLWTGIFAAILVKRPSGREWLGLILGFAGIILLNMENSFQAQPLGALILILGPMSWAFGSMLSKRIALPQGWMAIAFQTLGAAVLVSLFRIGFGEGLNAPPNFQTVSAIIYLALMGTIVGFTAYMYLLRTVRPALATSYAYINPIVAIMLGFIFLGETISQTGIIAMIIILVGVIIVIFARSKD
jgi:drug/metabolite transporter (DMT)-like permease